jgi:hypothetical protein
MELLERAVAVAELTGELAATGRHGRVVLVTGEAGIGKSTLVGRFRQLQSAEAEFLIGACDPLLTPRALGPLHDMARELGEPLPALLAAGRREAVFPAVLERLAASARRRVVVIEDVHWADEATLDLLVFLGRRLDRIPVLFVVTYRDDELGIDHPLRAVLGRLPTSGVRRLRVEPLSEAAVEELARRAGRPAAGLRKLTGGNPLLVTEVLAAGDTGVPLTVRDLALARVAGLPAPARELVRLVSVVPTPVEPWLLETAEQPAPATVDACVAAGLLVAGAGGVGFRHELLRRAVEGSLPVLVRRELNRRVLTALTGAAGSVDVARLVHHAREAGEIEAVVRYAPEAARQAAKVAAHREAVDHYRAVLEHAGLIDDATRADLLDGLSVEAYLAGLAGAAVTARRAAVDLREAAGDGERLGAGLRWLSRMHWWDGNRGAAEAAAARAVAVLGPLPPGHELAMAYGNQAQLDMLAGRHEAALHRAGQALDLARRLVDRETVTHALTTIGSVRLHAGDPAGRTELV